MHGMRIVFCMHTRCVEIRKFPELYLFPKKITTDQPLEGREYSIIGGVHGGE
jgi:hypothetical protein